MEKNNNNQKHVHSSKFKIHFSFDCSVNSHFPIYNIISSSLSTIYFFIIELLFRMGGDFAKYDAAHYTKGALAGGICCSITHAAMCPLDVVKTRMQLDPIKYNMGMAGSFRKVVAEEGAGALATGLGPTAVGYFVQGWFKFGGVEFFKINFAQSFGEEKAWEYRTAIYLLSAAMAEFIADIFLCPLEATRIRLVSNPTYATGLMSHNTRTPLAACDEPCECCAPQRLARPPINHHAITHHALAAPPPCAPTPPVSRLPLPSTATRTHTYHIDS